MPFTRFDIASGESLPKIDKRDEKILKLLAEDARRPLKSIAKAIAISPEGCGYRIKRLMEKKVIGGFVPYVSFSTLDFTRFHLYLLLNEQHNEEFPVFIDAIKKHPSVVSIIEYADRWDYKIAILAKNTREFNDIFLQCFGPFQHLIQDKMILAEVKRYCNITLPHVPSVQTDVISNAMLEEKDFVLLKALETDARASTYDLAKKLKMSPDAVSHRLKKLQERMILRRTTIVCNLSLLGYGWYTLALNLKKYDEAIDASLRAFFDKEPNILYAAKTVGQWDLLFHIIAKDTMEFARLTRQIRAQFSKVIKNYDAWVAVKEHHHVYVPDCLKKVVEK